MEKTPAGKPEKIPPAAAEQPAATRAPAVKPPGPMALVTPQPAQAGNATPEKTVEDARAHAAPLRQETQPPTAEPLEKRLQDFLHLYSDTYSSKDLEAFVQFFTPDATEQGQSFQSVLPVYQETFSQIKSMDYAIRIRSFTAEPKTDRVRVEGRFQAQYELQTGARGSSSGNIVMDIEDLGDTFRIRNLQYAHN
jgi:hypothetical protein